MSGPLPATGTIGNDLDRARASVAPDFDQAVQREHPIPADPVGTAAGKPNHDPTVGSSPAYSFGTAVCEVSVDMDTGKVKIDQFTDYHDCGTPINPQAVHGQVEGAVVMGASKTILEDVQFDEKGVILNPNLHGYLMMSIKDAPEIFSGLVDSYEPRGPFGAKEIGEGSTLPVLGAVAHAIANATGVWVKDLPITPEKILKAIKESRQVAQAVAK